MHVERYILTPPAPSKTLGSNAKLQINFFAPIKPNFLLLRITESQLGTPETQYWETRPALQTSSGSPCIVMQRNHRLLKRLNKPLLFLDPSSIASDGLTYVDIDGQGILWNRYRHFFRYQNGGRAPQHPPYAHARKPGWVPVDRRLFGDLADLAGPQPDGTAQCPGRRRPRIAVRRPVEHLRRPLRPDLVWKPRPESPLF